MSDYRLKRNDDLAAKLNILAYVVSAVVLILVGLMRRYKIDLGIDFTFLPPIHAILNTICALCLIIAVRKIKVKDLDGHRKFIFGAMVCSALFLLCYVLYHFTTEETRYCKEGISKTIYFIILISHIVLAGLSLPFILVTFIRGYTGQIDLHLKISKWVYYVWLCVAVTGPICYLMLYPCYK